MATVSEEDLQRKRDKNDKLREQIAAAEADAEARSRSQANEIESAQLDAETARLEARLQQAKAAARVSVAKEAAVGPLAAAKEQLKAAQAAKDNPVGPVDTNAGSEDDEKKKG